MEIVPYHEGLKEQTRKLVLGILREEFGWGKAKRPDLENISGVYQKDPKSQFWVALHENNVVGTIALLHYGRNRGYLKRMYVDKLHRSSGLANRLLETLLAHAKASQLKKIFLGTSPEMVASMKFYEKNGFKKIHRLPKDFPDYGDSVFYRLDL